jgi:hypothetical protein
MTAINPVSDSPLEGYWGVDGSQHVIFIGTDDHIHQLDVAPGATGWVDNDLTALTGPPPYTIPESVPRSGLGGFCGADNSQQVNYVGGDYCVHMLYSEPSGHGWVDGAIGPASLNTPMPGYYGSDGSKWVFYVAGGPAGTGIHEFYTAPGAVKPGWTDNDLTASTGGVQPHGDTIDAYRSSDGSRHVNFIGADGHVHELSIGTGETHWANNDLTAPTGAVGPLDGTALNSYAGAGGSRHVNFIGVDGHIHQLFVAGGETGWVDGDLTKLAEAVAPASGTVLDAYGGADGSQHVSFIGVDGHVHQVHVAVGGTGWSDADLTTLA